MDRHHHHHRPTHHHRPAPPTHHVHHPPPPPPHHVHHPPPPPPHHHHHHHVPPVVVFPSPPPPVIVVDHHHSTPVHHYNDDLIFTRPSVKMYTKADVYYSLSISHGKVILVRSNPSDPLQHWIKDDRHSTRVRDAEGLPSFALINKATGQALKHAVGHSHPVQLIQYNPSVLDESILWTEKDLGDGYHAVRMVNNIRLNIDAFHGDKHHGGIHDGTVVGLWDWNRGDNQRWLIIPHCK